MPDSNGFASQWGNQKFDEAQMRHPPIERSREALNRSARGSNSGA